MSRFLSCRDLPTGFCMWSRHHGYSHSHSWIYDFMDIQHSFMNACDCGDLATVATNVDANGVTFTANCQDEGGFSGLMRSIYNNKMNVFHYLLALKDINVNLAHKYDGTALHFAVNKNNKEAVAALVMTDGIDMTIKNYDGQTAKQLARATGRHDLVAVMDEAGMAKVMKEAASDAQQDLARGVAAMAKSDDFSDFTIICQGQEIKCHKMVLAVMSEVFKTAFTSKITEVQENRLEIEDASPESVKGMVSHMYTGSIPTNIGDIVAEMLHLAEKYKVGSLKKACENCLRHDLAVENAVNTIILVDRYKCSPQLRAKVLKFFHENGSAILQTSDWTTALESGSYAEIFDEVFPIIFHRLFVAILKN